MCGPFTAAEWHKSLTEKTPGNETYHSNGISSSGSGGKTKRRRRGQVKMLYKLSLFLSFTRCCLTVEEQQGMGEEAEEAGETVWMGHTLGAI